MSRRPGPPSIDGLYSLKIDNISYQTTPQDLRRLFEKYGEIGDIHIPRDRYTKQSKGFGFVRYYNKRDAEYAMDRMDGRWLDGREVRVAVARYERPIDERGRSSGYSSGYRSSRRSRSRSRSRTPRRRRSPSRSRSRSASAPNTRYRSESPRHSPSPARSGSRGSARSGASRSASPANENGNRRSSRSPSGSRSPE